MNRLQKLLRNCDGITSIEYSLIAVLVSVFLIVGANYMGQSLNNSFNNVNNGFTGNR